jgi:Ca2+/H+ antiporter, TMEM165/GDT1 family
LDALLTSFVAALLAEWGDKTQLLLVAFAIRYRRPLPILAGAAVAAFANSLIAAGGGILLNGFITLRAISLLVALALIFAGAGGFFRSKQPDMASTWRTGPFLTTAVCFFLLEFGDKTQFLTFSLAAQFNSFALASAGATAGVLVAGAPAAILADRFAATLPLRAIRLGIGILFLVIGFIIAVNALRLT